MCMCVFVCARNSLSHSLTHTLSRVLSRSLSLYLSSSLASALSLSLARDRSLMHLPNGYVGLGGWAEREGACVSGAPSASILLRATPRHTIRPPPSTARPLAPRRSLLTGFVRTRAHTHRIGGRRAGREGGSGRESETHENHVSAGPRTRAHCLGRQQTLVSHSRSLSLSLCSPAIESWAPARWLGGGVLC